MFNKLFNRRSREVIIDRKAPSFSNPTEDLNDLSTISSEDDSTSMGSSSNSNSNRPSFQLESNDDPSNNPNNPNNPNNNKLSNGTQLSSSQKPTSPLATNSSTSTTTITTTSTSSSSSGKLESSSSLENLTSTTSNSNSASPGSGSPISRRNSDGNNHVVTPKSKHKRHLSVGVIVSASTAERAAEVKSVLQRKYQSIKQSNGRYNPLEKRRTLQLFMQNEPQGDDDHVNIHKTIPMLRATEGDVEDEDNSNKWGWLTSRVCVSLIHQYIFI